VTAVPVPLVKPHVKKEPSYGQTMVTYGMLGEKNAPHPLWALQALQGDHTAWIT